MKSISLTTKALLLAAATPFAFAGTAAFAQDATTPAPAPAPAPAQESPAATPVQNAVNATTDQTDPATAQTPGDEIVVTGSLFRRTDTETPSPVTVLTSETLQRAGVTT
ncbi:MAG: TonB-dependent receptor, partial [Oxalobacteraceae bacterium]